jgi:hypothetical protein
MKTFVWNMCVVVVMAVACSWCDGILRCLWGPVFSAAHSLGLSFEIKMLFIAVPSAVSFFVGGFFASRLLRGIMKWRWMLVMVLMGCLGNVLGLRFSADMSLYRRIFITVVFALMPWFALLGGKIKLKKGNGL